MRTKLRHLLIAGLGVPLLGSPLPAATLLLKNGGRLECTVVRSPQADGESPADRCYVVQVGDDVLLRIDADQVGKVLEATEDERQYAELLAHMPATVEGHASLANWCHEHQMSSLRDFHWQQVIELEPNHADARRMLGYSLVRGQWLRPDERMRAQGYVKENGVWRLPQQRQVEEQQKQAEIAAKEFRKNLRTWRGWLGGRRHDEAVARIREIRDPLAAEGLHELLKSESDVDVRFLFVDVLGRLQTAAAVDALIDTAIHDADLEVRLKCVEYLREFGQTRATGSFVGYLRNSNNRTINRAAVALGRLGNAEAVYPLIQSLVTQHETVIVPTGGDIQPSFSNGPGGGGMGLNVGNRPKKVRRDVNNKSVLEALISITGKNYQYSVADWKNWYISTRALPDHVNLRRDG